MKKVRFEDNTIDPPIKRFCECTGCSGCNGCGGPSIKSSPPTWTEIRCKNKDCRFYVCIYCIDIVNNVNGYCNYCLGK